VALHVNPGAQVPHGPASCPPPLDDPALDPLLLPELDPLLEPLLLPELDPLLEPEPPPDVEPLDDPLLLDPLDEELPPSFPPVAGDPPEVPQAAMMNAVSTQEEATPRRMGGILTARARIAKPFASSLATG
jgi:hypothetical protein